MKLHTQKLKVSKYSWWQARKLFYFTIRWSELSPISWRDIPDNQLCLELDRIGYDYKSVIKSLERDHTYVLPIYENILTSGSVTIEINSTNIKAIHQTIIEGVVLTEQEISGRSYIDTSPYKTLFTESCISRDQAIKEENLQMLYTAISKGFASIDAFMNMRATIYNHHVVGSKKLTPNSNISLEKKLKEWLPEMTNLIDGQRAKIVFLQENWLNSETSDYTYLKNLRNNADAHPKMGHGIKSIREFAEALNKYRAVIAELLFCCHQAFYLPVPLNIVRAMLYPDIYVSKEKNYSDVKAL